MDHQSPFRKMTLRQKIQRETKAYTVQRFEQKQEVCELRAICYNPTQSFQKQGKKGKQLKSDILQMFQCCKCSAYLTPIFVIANISGTLVLNVMFPNTGTKNEAYISKTVLI